MFTGFLFKVYLEPTEVYEVRKRGKKYKVVFCKVQVRFRDSSWFRV